MIGPDDKRGFGLSGCPARRSARTELIGINFLRLLSARARWCSPPTLLGRRVGQHRNGRYALSGSVRTRGSCCRTRRPRLLERLHGNTRQKRLAHISPKSETDCKHVEDGAATLIAADQLLLQPSYRPSPVLTGIVPQHFTFGEHLDETCDA